MPITIIVLLVLFSISTNKEDRYILPLFLYIGIMIAAWILSLTKIKKILIPSLILISFFQFFIICYKGILPFPASNLLKKYFSHPYSPHWGLFSSEIDRRNWRDPIKKVIKTIENNTNKDTAVVLFISDAIYIPSEIKYQSLTQKFHLMLFHPVLNTDNTNLSESELNTQCNNWMDSSEFVMLEKKSPHDAFSLIHTQKLLNYFKQNFNKFEYIDNIQFPENRLFIVYKKTV